MIRSRAAQADPPLQVVPGWGARDWEAAAVKLKLAHSPNHAPLPSVARGARVAWGAGRVYLFLCAPAHPGCHVTPPSPPAHNAPNPTPLTLRVSGRPLSAPCPPRSPSPDRFVSLSAVRSGAVDSVSWESTFHALEEAKEAAAARPPDREADRVGLPEALQADAAFMKGLLSPGEAPEEAPLGDDLLDLLVAEVGVASPLSPPQFAPACSPLRGAAAQALRARKAALCFARSLAPAPAANRRACVRADPPPPLPPDPQDILEDGGESLLSASLPEPEAMNLAPGGVKLPSFRATDMPWKDPECVFSFFRFL